MRKRSGEREIVIKGAMWSEERKGTEKGFGEGARDRTLGLLAPLCVLVGDTMMEADTQ